MKNILGISIIEDVNCPNDCVFLFPKSQTEKIVDGRLDEVDPKQIGLLRYGEEVD